MMHTEDEDFESRLEEDLGRGAQEGGQAVLQYRVKITQMEPQRIPPYVNIEGEFVLDNRPGIRKHLDWIKLFCIARGAVAEVRRIGSGRRQKQAHSRDG